MRSLRVIVAALLLAVTGVAHAQFSGTVTVVNDYDFRGVSLSGKDPAIQGSIDWAHDSGLYAGAWASCCLDFGPGTATDNEVDLYAGFTGEVEGGFGWDAGLVYYYYDPDTDNVDYFEFYFGGSYNIFDAKFWYADDLSNTGQEGYYLEGNLNYGLPEGFTLLAHVGYNFGDYWKNINGDETIDYSIGVGYTLGHFDLELKYIDTNTDVEVTSDAFNNEGRVFASISTTFPWEKE